MNRHEALQWLANESHHIPEGQRYTVHYFSSTDAPGVARLFYAVYGQGYPVDTYYIPECLIAEHEGGAIRSTVARTDSGDIVSHSALYRSSAPNPRLYECGAGLTLPSYRSTTAFFRTFQLAMELVGKDGIDGIFGEAVCNHTITQRLVLHAKSVETAVEPALMPAKAYETEWQDLGRVGCIVSFRVEVDQRKTMFVPACYQPQLSFILDGTGLDRELVCADPSIPFGEAVLDIQRFDDAGVVRGLITKPGADLPKHLRKVEDQALADNYALLQFFIDLGQPWAGGVVEQMRGQGYALGGLLPIWFGTDGLLLQKHLVDPGFADMKIHSDRGRALVELVKNDWQRSQSCTRS
ncbi:hypothetical protein MASR1M90_05160 [Desulfovibrionales bacterium]